MSQVDEIKDRLNIVDVVSSYVKLQKAGRNYKGLSPFTKEKTPSFFVSPDKGMYYCFSTNKGGDIFTFIEEMERVDFMGALKILADKAGIVLSKEKFEKTDQKDRIYRMIEKIAFFYQKNLAGNKDAFGYLIKRGLKTETIKEFRVGFAPKEWDSALLELKRNGYSEREIETAGLVIARQGQSGFYDRFRSRIMFPISDVAGRIVGFSGRIFGEEEGSAKYINTPETPLYHKSRILYGFDKAKEAIRQNDSCILVEGQMDVLASFQAGVKNVVAVSGTSLTIDHLKQIKRFTNNLVMALDADTAGQNASDRSAKLALSLDMDISVVEIIGGKDPADIVKEDPKRWEEAVKASKPYIDFRIESLKRMEDPRNVANKIKETVFPHIASMYGGMKKDRAIQKIGTSTGTSADAIREEYENWRKTYVPDAIEGLSAPKDPFSFIKGTRKETIERRILGLIFWLRDDSEKTKMGEKIESGYLALVSGKSPSMIEELTEEEKKKLSFEAEILYGEHEDLEKETSDLLLSFEVELIHEDLENLLKRLRMMEREEGTPEKEKETEKLLKEYQALSLKKEALKTKLQ